MGKPPETDMEKYGEEKKEPTEEVKLPDPEPVKTIEERAEVVAQEKAKKVTDVDPQTLDEESWNLHNRKEPVEDPTQGEVD